SLLRQLETSDPLHDGAGKGALLVAEQLALQQPGGDSRTIQLDERAAPARAQVVQGPSDELLARAAFAPNEYGGAGGGDRLRFLENAVEGGAIPDDLPEVVLGSDLPLQVGVLLGELVLQRLELLEGDGVLDGHGHLVGNELQEAYVWLLRIRAQKLRKG